MSKNRSHYLTCVFEWLVRGTITFMLAHSLFASFVWISAIFWLLFFVSCIMFLWSVWMLFTCPEEE